MAASSNSGRFRKKNAINKDNSGSMLKFVTRTETINIPGMVKGIVNDIIDSVFDHTLMFIEGFMKMIGLIDSPRLKSEFTIFGFPILILHKLSSLLI